MKVAAIVTASAGILIALWAPAVFISAENFRRAAERSRVLDAEYEAGVANQTMGHVSASEDTLRFEGWARSQTRLAWATTAVSASCFVGAVVLWRRKPPPPAGSRRRPQPDPTFDP